MKREFDTEYPHNKDMRAVTKEQRVMLLGVGETITIGKKEYQIERVSLAKDLGEKFDLVIPDDVIIYWLLNSGVERKGAYIPEKNIILFFENTDEETQHHELTHAVEYHQEATPELLALYDLVKSTITDNSFENDFISFNFMKNIHEFIADGRTKQAFIEALKKEGLYDEFVKQTAYLFARPTEDK